MTSRTKIGAPRLAVLAVLSMLAGSGAVFAQEHGLGEPSESDHEHFDARFSHNRSYLNYGYRVHEAPRSGHAIDRDRHRYWYDRGEWYRREGADWVVTGAPVGVLVSVLPPFYTTVMFSGTPYYYANDTYYVLNSERDEYQVVSPPAGINSAANTGLPAPDGQLYVYRRSEVSPQQQATDRYECDISAVHQTGFDPTKEDGGVSREAAPAMQASYFRAQATCLEARGYKVR